MAMPYPRDSTASIGHCLAELPRIASVGWLVAFCRVFHSVVIFTAGSGVTWKTALNERQRNTGTGFVAAVAGRYISMWICGPSGLRANESVICLRIALPS